MEYLLLFLGGVTFCSTVYFCTFDKWEVEFVARKKNETSQRNGNKRIFILCLKCCGSERGKKSKKKEWRKVTSVEKRKWFHPHPQNSYISIEIINSVCDSTTHFTNDEFDERVFMWMKSVECKLLKNDFRPRTALILCPCSHSSIRICLDGR